jgi:hypothetical protein
LDVRRSAGSPRIDRPAGAAAQRLIASAAHGVTLVLSDRLHSSHLTTGVSNRRNAPNYYCFMAVASSFDVRRMKTQV